MSGGCLKGVGPFKGDSGAIRLPGQGAGALLRVPHGQAGLWSARGSRDSMEKLETKGSQVQIGSARAERKRKRFG